MLHAYNQQCGPMEWLSQFLGQEQVEFKEEITSYFEHAKVSKTDWGTWGFSCFFCYLAYTHDPLWKKIKFCIDLGLILEVIGEPWGTFFCSMSSWERSWNWDSELSEVQGHASERDVHGYPWVSWMPKYHRFPSMSQCPLISMDIHEYPGISWMSKHTHGCPRISGSRWGRFCFHLFYWQIGKGFVPIRVLSSIIRFLWMNRSIYLLTIPFTY